jgi:hypothetical protein
MHGNFPSPPSQPRASGRLPSSQIPCKFIVERDHCLRSDCKFCHELEPCNARRRELGFPPLARIQWKGATVQTAGGHSLHTNPFEQQPLPRMPSNPFSQQATTPTNPFGAPSDPTWGAPPLHQPTAAPFGITTSSFTQAQTQHPFQSANNPFPPQAAPTQWQPPGGSVFPAVSTFQPAPTPNPFVNSAPAASARPFINPFSNPQAGPAPFINAQPPLAAPPFINPFAQPAPVAAPPLARRSFCHLTDAQLLKLRQGPSILPLSLLSDAPDEFFTAHISLLPPRL